MLCLRGTPPSAWNIAVRSCCCRGILLSLGGPKEVGVLSVEAWFARCPKFEQVGRLLVHRYRLLFSLCGIIAPIHLVFIEPGFFMLSEYHDEDLTIPVSVVFLCSFGMLGPKC